MGDAQVRANYSASIKRIYEWTKDADFENQTIESIQVRANRLASVWNDFSNEDKLVHKNMKNMSEDDIKISEKLYEQTEKWYMDADAVLLARINEISKANQASAPAAVGATSLSNESFRENITVTIPNYTRTGLRMNPEKLPDFYGDYTQWPKFRDLFTRLVHEIPEEEMVPLAKFNALDQHLKGEAAALIAGITRSDENYAVAWKTVFDVYNNPKLIVNALMDSLYNLRAVKDENPASLRFIASKYKAVVMQLEAMEIDVATWDPILMYHLVDLLDPTTRRDWELKNATSKKSSLTEMLKFLDERITGLLNVNRVGRHRLQSVIVRPQQQQQQQNHHRSRSVAPTVAHASLSNKNDRRKSTGNVAAEMTCPVCKGDHLVPDCEKFISLACFPRMMRARDLKLCYGCLGRSHQLSQCLAPICTYCPGKKHHPLICFQQYDIERGNAPSPTVAVVNEINSDGEIVLATAMVNVQSACGEMMIARALCDSGAQANLITEDLVRRLRIHRNESSSSVQAIGGANGMAVRGTVKLSICATSPSNVQYNFTISALVMSRISSWLPSSHIDIGKWPAEVMDNLADSTLHVPGKIDLLFGAHVWSQILRPKIHRSECNGLIAQDSRLGWLVLGAAVSPVPKMHLVATLQVNELSQLNNTIQRLWELEKVPEKHHRSPEEKFCAEVFERETFRDATGRYVVSIPIDPEAVPLGDSRSKALQRFYQIESRFARDPNYHREYVNFMRDYIERGHMSLVKTSFQQGEEHYFIPHHGISSAKKKFRVVFDGSAATTSGQSLNDIQMKGERLQDNLPDIILRFRLNKIALTADVQQMYRQILVNENQRNLQLIFFRENPLESIKVYRLNTVTYGLKHAPHSAVSALQKCARDHAETHPLASKSALHDYYMDDLSTGGDDVENVIELYRQMKAMMRSGGFPLRKWATNNWNVLSAFENEDIPKTEPIEFNADDIRSVLGTYWNPMTDELVYTVGDLNIDNIITKRIATSEVAKLFDPTGLLAAVIARGKLLIRQLWLQKLDWDQKLKEPMLSIWKNFFASLHRLTEIRVPRWIGSFKSTEIELCGFADASEAMYAAVVYYRVPASDGFQCGILAAKTKVAPLKKVTIPRLELCGALLLAQLMSSIKNALYNRQVKCQYWSDSTIALAWIKESPHSLKTFVGNRVAEIQNETPKDVWKHVRSQENPADMASRGIDANDLIGNDLWWRGPNWLSLPNCEWPGSQSSSFQMTDTEQEQMKMERVAPVIALLKIESFWIANRYSSFTQLCLVTAFVKRVFNYNAPNAGVARGSAERKLLSIEHVKPLTRDEVESAERFWLKKMQSYDFPTEIKACQQGNNLHRSSKLFGLSPFLDEHGILRVGGRLSNAPIPYATKFPIIIDGRSKLTQQIIRRAHLQMLHGGAQITTRTLREKYWIVGGRNAIRSVIHKCVRCVTMRGQTCTQQMADLVPERVLHIEPFAIVSLDYCGPFEVKRYPGRCNTKVKVWIAVFICMVSRAIHLELVLDLTSDAFIDAYQRFAARRGYCAQLISDNAKTFVGAKRQMLEIEEVFRKSSQSSYFAARGIEWKFIMPRSPSQGGSHEVAVKLFKHHLRRVMGTHTLSGFELNSLMIRIEGCLNSRPLAVQSDDPNDHVVITPAQLVTNRRSLTTVPTIAVPVEPLFDEEPLTNHHLRKIQYYHQYIWRQWQSDYINSLQCRGRWQNKQPNLEIDDIVLVKEDNLAPQHWLMGKIVEVHPGKDGEVRNVTIRCSNGSTLKRAVQKLCKLPVAQDVPASPKA